jgi:uncharacterized protein YqgC (DUF456 family)
MIETAIDQTAGGLAVALFALAWWTNRKGSSKVAGITAVIFAIIGSGLLYAAPWSLWCANLVASVIGMFGNAPVHPIMTIICVALMLGVVYDLYDDPTYNVGAVWALIFAPIMARGTSGIAGSFLEELFGSASMAFLDLVKQLAGA